MKINKIKSLITVFSLFALCSLLSAYDVHASTTHPTNTPTPTATASSPTQEAQNNQLVQQIDQLKDKIASQVAKLNLVEKRGVIGTVTDTTDNQITLSDLEGNTQFVDVDEITKFASPSAKPSFGISDLTKGTKVNVVGTYNKESQRILARFVTVITLPTYVVGEITDIDKPNYTITVTDTSGKKTVIDIESVTKTYDYTPETNFKKSGFSKLLLGEQAVVVGYANKQSPNRITATRITEFPDLPKDPNIAVAETTTPTTEPSPTIKTPLHKTTTAK